MIRKTMGSRRKKGGRVGKKEQWSIPLKRKQILKKKKGK